MKPGAPQADHVQGRGAGGEAVRDHERQAVLHHLGVAAHHREPPDPAELVDARAAAQEGALADLDVAGQHHVVRQDRPVADAVVVGDVHERHQEAVRADQRSCRRASSSDGW